MLEEDQLTRELKLGGVNYDEMRKWAKTMYKQKHILQRGLPTRKRQGEGGDLSPLLKLDQSQEKHILK
jgi:hypothetical protein